MKNIMRVFVAWVVFVCSSSTVLAQCLTADQLIAKADAYRIQFRSKEALELYAQAFAMKGEVRPGTLYSIAMCQYDAGDVKNAFKNFTQLVNQNANDHQSWNWLARCTRDNGNYPDAIRYLLIAEKKAVKQSAEWNRKRYWNDLRATYYFFGAALYKKGDYYNAHRCSLAAEKWHKKLEPETPLFPEIAELKKYSQLKLKE